jgi:lactate permease
VASSAYGALLAVVLLQLWSPVAAALGRVTITPEFPATATGLGWVNGASAGRAISVFGHPGALILYAAAVGYAVYRRDGRYSADTIRRIGRGTVVGARAPTAAILGLVAMSTVMTDAGMTAVLGQALAQLAGSILPALAPFVGGLGGFATGANTSSNILFGAMVEQAAQSAGVAPAVAVAALSAGGAIGSVLSPAKLVVGASTVGLLGSEGRLLREALGYGLVILVVVSVSTVLAVR